MATLSATPREGLAMSETTVRGKGEGSIFRDETRGLWTAVIELPPDLTTGKRRRKTIRRKDKGDLLEARSKLLITLDQTGDLTTASPTLKTWVTTWLKHIASNDVKPRTLSTYRSYMNQYVLPSIGRYRLDQLTPAHVRRVHEAVIEQGLSPTTALQAHRILAKCLTDAMREGRVGRNVTTLVAAPRKAISHQNALNAQQAAVLLRHVAKDLSGARWAVAILTGMRQGEQLGLTREMIDLDRGVITVAWALTRVAFDHGCEGGACGKVRGGNCPERVAPIPAGMEARQLTGGLWLMRPKSRAGWREVPMAPVLLEIMRRYMTEYDPQDLVFTRDDGRPHDPATDYHSWIALLEECGLPKVKLHSARHTTATLLYELGVPETTRMAILGHSSATVTAGYTRVSDAIAQDAMGRLGTLLSIEP